jgi:hypothetical protein
MQIMQRAVRGRISPWPYSVLSKWHLPDKSKQGVRVREGGAEVRGRKTEHVSSEAAVRFAD